MPKLKDEDGIPLEEGMRIYMHDFDRRSKLFGTVYKSNPEDFYPWSVKLDNGEDLFVNNFKPVWMSNKDIEKKDAFLKDVFHEVQSLRHNATPEEKERLDFDTLDYNEPALCIYGQLTEDCSSLRAKELMDIGCIRVMDVPDGVDDIKEVNIEDEKFNINGENTGQGWIYSEEFKEYGRDYTHLSALEGYICTKDAKNKEIIDYIKGNINELVL